MRSIRCLARFSFPLGAIPKKHSASPFTEEIQAVLTVDNGNAVDLDPTTLSRDQRT